MKEQIIITFDREKYLEEWGIILPPNDIMLKVLNPQNISSESFKIEIKIIED